MSSGDADSEGDAEAENIAEGDFSAEWVCVASGDSVAQEVRLAEGDAERYPVLVPPLVRDEEGKPEGEDDSEGLAVPATAGATAWRRATPWAAP